MSNRSTQYDREFKKKAVELPYARGNTTEIAEELGIDKWLLYRWGKEFKKYENNSFPGQGKPKMELFEWIETWYNRKRRHSALGYKTIEEFENLNNYQKIAA
jgi:transposase-like protein